MFTKSCRTWTLAALLVSVSGLAGCQKNPENDASAVTTVEKGGGSGAIGTPDRGTSSEPRRGSNAIDSENPKVK